MDEYTVLRIVRTHMRKQYGPIDWLEPLVYHHVQRGDSREEVMKYLWLNQSGGNAAENCANAIFNELGLE